MRQFFNILQIVMVTGLVLGLCGGAVAEKIDLPPSVPVPSVMGEALPLPAPAPKKSTSEKVSEPKDGTNTQTESQKKEPVVLRLPAENAQGQEEGVMVVELFSTPACPFCPKADALMQSFTGHKDIIALSCHVDYFDIKEGSHALPICSSRQSMYERTLDRGPKYTPQIVFNGRDDATGYLIPEMNQALERAVNTKAHRLNMIKTSSGIFLTNLPFYKEGEYAIWLFPYYREKTINITEGANSGKAVTYYNLIASAGFMGNWDGAPKTLKVNPKLTDDIQNFALIVQDKSTSHIIAAGRY